MRLRWAAAAPSHRKGVPMSRTLLTTVLVACLVGGPAPAAETRQVAGFAPNPGNLLMFEHVPDGLARGASLVVALHGCTQSAREFGDDSGWAGLAERRRFALLLPQQQEANNADLCFDWFRDGDNHRDRGEAASIRAMVDRMVADHGLDPRRVFVTGLSAGGAMAAVMLAAYPEAFVGGEIVAGVPYGCASTEGQPVLAAQRQAFLANPLLGEAAWAAYACGITRAGPLPIRLTPFDREPGAWGDLFREAGAPTPPVWPRVSLWQGDADPTVHPTNLRELLDQWTAVEGIDEVPDREEATAAYRHREFADAAGEVRVETYELPGMGHAVPVDPGSGPAQCGRVADHFADQDVCAAFRIARFWGLIDGR